MQIVLKERHLVCFTDVAGLALSATLWSGVHGARVLRRAMVLLMPHEWLVDSETCVHTDVSELAILAIRHRYCREGLERATYDTTRSSRRISRSVNRSKSSRRP